jgi:hypothetical protein
MSTGISPQLLEAIRKLFGGDLRGLQFLDSSAAESSHGTLEDRVRQLRETLEGWVIAMSNELDELGEEEQPRLEAEARATLIALREVNWLFPMIR